MQAQARRAPMRAVLEHILPPPQAQHPYRSPLDMRTETGESA
jgi:hypothetical protein